MALVDDDQAVLGGPFGTSTGCASPRSPPTAARASSPCSNCATAAGRGARTGSGAPRTPAFRTCPCTTWTSTGSGSPSSRSPAAHRLAPDAHPDRAPGASLGTQTAAAVQHRRPARSQQPPHRPALEQHQPLDRPAPQDDRDGSTAARTIELIPAPARRQQHPLARGTDPHPSASVVLSHPDAMITPSTAQPLPVNFTRKITQDAG